MSRGAYETPEVPCPYCATACAADWCDVGVGLVQCGPYRCDACGASEIGPYDTERPLTDDERRTGWYAPGSPAGSSANVLGGQIVDHRTMKAAYQAEFAGNPRYEVEGAVEAWFELQRTACKCPWSP